MPEAADTHSSIVIFEYNHGTMHHAGWSARGGARTGRLVQAAAQRREVASEGSTCTPHDAIGGRPAHLTTPSGVELHTATLGTTPSRPSIACRTASVFESMPAVRAKCAVHPTMASDGVLFSPPWRPPRPPRPGTRTSDPQSGHPSRPRTPRTTRLAPDLLRSDTLPRQPPPSGHPPRLRTPRTTRLAPDLLRSGTLPRQPPPTEQHHPRHQARPRWARPPRDSPTSLRPRQARPSRRARPRPLPSLH